MGNNMSNMAGNMGGETYKEKRKKTKFILVHRYVK